MSKKPVFLVLGAGAGIGGNVAKNLLKRAIMQYWQDAVMKMDSTLLLVT